MFQGLGASFASDFLGVEAQMGHALDSVCNSSVDVRDVTALCSLLNRRLFVETHANTDIAVRYSVFACAIVNPTLVLLC